MRSSRICTKCGMKLVDRMYWEGGRAFCMACAYDISTEDASSGYTPSLQFKRDAEACRSRQALLKSATQHTLEVCSVCNRRYKLVDDVVHGDICELCDTIPLNGQGVSLRTWLQTRYDLHDDCIRAVYAMLPIWALYQQSLTQSEVAHE